MWQHVLQVESCEACQKNSDKLVVTSTELHPVPVRTTWYHVAIDFIGPISPVSVSGNRSVFSLCARNIYFTTVDKLHILSINL